MKRVVYAATAAVLLSPVLAGASEIVLKGDLRARYESIDQDGKPTRNRERIRARLGAEGKVNDTVKAFVRMATGADDPVSANQTLAGAFGKKDFLLDQAYLQWKPEDMGTTLQAGKMPTPFIRPGDLLFDDDLNPEGASVGFKHGEDVVFMANVGAFSVEERSSADDTMLYGAQAALKFAVAEETALTAGASYFMYDNIQGFSPLYNPLSAAGNTTTKDVKTNLFYASEFNIAEGFVIVDTKVGSLPVSVFGDYVVNTEASIADTGYMFGTTLGKAKEKGSMQFGYDYRELEQDATVGAFSDSDSFGGGTDGNGHRVSFKYMLADNVYAGAAYFVDSIKISGDELDYNRLQIDVGASF